MADLPSKTESFRWPELPPLDPQTRLPAGSKKTRMMSFLMLALYLAPLIALVALVERQFTDAILKKLVPIPILFFGGLSIVMFFAAIPARISHLYYKRRLKEAEQLCRMYLFFVGNFSPYCLDTALMKGLLAEVLRASGRIEEAEKAIREGIVICLVSEQLPFVQTKNKEEEKLKEIAKSMEETSMPTKGMLYETFGALLRDRKMFDKAIEAGKLSIKLVDEKLAKLPARQQASVLDPTPAQRKMQLDLAMSSATYELGLTYLETGDHDQALSLFKKARTLREEHKSNLHYMANIISAIGRAYLAAGESSKAKKCAEEALALLTNTKLPVEELAKARALNVLSLAKNENGEGTEAKKLALQSQEIRQKWLAPGDPELV